MRVPADTEQSVRAITFVLAALLATATPAYGNGGTCLFDSKGLAGLKIGDPESKVREVFGSGYDTREHSGQMMQRRIEVRRSTSNENLYSIALGNSGEVMFIDILRSCKNADGVGIGTTLGAAKAKYGKAKLEPTDVGYFVIFDRMPSIGFMLANTDLPTKLRDLPDDSMSEKAERAILATSKAKFSQIRIYPE